MKLISPLAPAEIKKILNEQVDEKPSTLRCLLTLNASSFIGTSPVCDKINDHGFVLKIKRVLNFLLELKTSLER
jgi:hypothetical protein